MWKVNYTNIFLWKAFLWLIAYKYKTKSVDNNRLLSVGWMVFGFAFGAMYGFLWIDKHKVWVAAQIAKTLKVKNDPCLFKCIQIYQTLLTDCAWFFVMRHFDTYIDDTCKCQKNLSITGYRFNLVFLVGNGITFYNAKKM